MPRTIGELTAHADEMAAQMRDLLPDPNDEVDYGVLVGLRSGVAERAEELRETATLR